MIVGGCSAALATHSQTPAGLCAGRHPAMDGPLIAAGNVSRCWLVFHA